MVGNMTVALCVTFVIGATFGGGFLAAGAHPFYALTAFLLPCVVFMVFFFPTLKHASDHPDAAVTSEECYARVVETRLMAAKNPTIVRIEPPVVAMSSQMAKTAGLIPHSGGDDA